ncbi:hypothetical protein HDU93_007412 [Gonapodya sp. JEL0774]|nr:hypothetical protein HDU93_007412 [Gonapodya sp. JEL0774]
MYLPLQMFLSIEHHRLVATLHEHQNDLELAINALLASDDSVDHLVESLGDSDEGHRQISGLSSDYVDTTEDSIDYGNLITSMGVNDPQMPVGVHRKAKDRPPDPGNPTEQTVQEHLPAPVPFRSWSPSSEPRPEIASAVLRPMPLRRLKSESSSPLKPARDFIVGSRQFPSGSDVNNTRSIGQSATSSESQSLFAGSGTNFGDVVPSFERAPSTTEIIDGLGETEPAQDLIADLFPTVPRSKLQRLVFLAEAEGAEDPVQEVAERLLPLMLDPPEGLTFEELVAQECDGACFEYGESCWWHGGSNKGQSQDVFLAAASNRSPANVAARKRKRGHMPRSGTKSFAAMATTGSISRFATPTSGNLQPSVRNASWSNVASIGVESRPVQGPVGFVLPASRSTQSSRSSHSEPPKLIYMSERDDPSNQGSSSSQMSGRNRRFDGWDGDVSGLAEAVVLASELRCTISAIFRSRAYLGTLPNGISIMLMLTEIKQSVS